MGLSEPRKRMKISHDPNNTNWTGNTDNYGQKIMQAQGWQPGDYLGARDANHADHYTAANASHIRVLIKTDNLGLGAKNGSGVGHGECTGLDAFKNLLGRLNGADEDELEKEQKSRDDLRRAIYTERKWGSIRFVKGGFLIGDKIQDLIDGEAERIRKLTVGDNSDSSTSSSSEEEAPVEKPKKSKKRKAEAERIPEVFAVKEKKPKKRRNLKAGLEEGSLPDEEGTADESEKKRRKKEKKEKKERKEQRRALKAGGLAESSTKESKKKSKKDKRKSNLDNIAESSESTTRTTTKESTPATPIVDSGRSTPLMHGRHAVRSRNIAQKRLASMDVASLNQIFMIKAPS